MIMHLHYNIGKPATSHELDTVLRKMAGLSIDFDAVVLQSENPIP